MYSIRSIHILRHLHRPLAVESGFTFSSANHTAAATMNSSLGLARLSIMTSLASRRMMSTKLEQNFDQVLTKNLDVETQTTGAIIPKWEVTEPVKEQLTSVILPFAQQNFLQVLFFPYTYPVMYYLDFLSSHLPPWLAIVGTTATMRLLFFPLVVKQNITGIKTNNIMPDTQRIQMKMSEAMRSGDMYNYALSRSKLKILFKENGLDMWSRLKPLVIQSPMFLTTFFLLNKLTRYPYLPLTTGGALWFTNLTIPDPFFILPILTCATMMATIEFGMEGSMQPRTMGPFAKWGMRSLPLLLFAFAHNFPAGVLLFWTTNNFFTLSYALLLKQKWIKKKFNIPERIVHDSSKLPLSNQGFKEAWNNAREKGNVSKSTLEIRRLDDIAFKKAGIGPLRKTYKEPPIKKLD